MTLYLQYIIYILIRWVVIEIIVCKNSLAEEQQTCIITRLTGPHLYVHRMTYMLQALDLYYSSRYQETIGWCIHGVRSSEAVNLSICNVTLDRSRAYGSSSGRSSSPVAVTLTQRNTRGHIWSLYGNGWQWKRPLPKLWATSKPQSYEWSITICNLIKPLSLKYQGSSPLMIWYL